MWRVNSVRSSSLMVCVTLALDPWTKILPPEPPPMLALEAWPPPPPPVLWEMIPAGEAGAGPEESRFWAGDESRSFEIS